MKIKKILILFLVLSLVVFTFTGCAKKEFTYSEGLDANGFWKGIKALNYVELPEYNGILIPKDVYEVTNEALQSEINALLSYHSVESQVTDRAVEEFDTVNIDYVGSIDGVDFEGGSTGGMGTDVTIGVTSYIDGFLEQLVGRSPGESFDINVRFPDDYGHDDLNGKDAVFAITINYIIDMVAPELNDAFVLENLSQFYEVNTVAELEEQIKGSLRSGAVVQYIQEYIFENSTIKSVPKKLIEYQEKSLILFYQQYADYYNMAFNDFLAEYIGMSSAEELIKDSEEDNIKTAKYYLILQAIAEDAGISVTDNDVAVYFSDNMGTNDYSEYAKTYGMPYLKLIVLHQSVMDFLENNIVME